MATSSVDICNQGVILIGDAGSITSFAEASRPAQVAAAQYRRIKETLLSKRNWKFASFWRPLNRLTTPPKARWAYAFAVPPGAFRVYEVDGDFDYEILEGGKQLHCDEPEVMGLCLMNVVEAYFPAFFETVLVERMAGVFGVGVLGKPDIARYWNNEAAGHLLEAEFLDDSMDPPDAPRMNELTRMRSAGGGILI